MVSISGLMNLISNAYIPVLVIMGLFILLALLSHFILVNYMHRIASRTRTDIDDVIIKTVVRPVYLLLILSGVNVSLKRIGVLSVAISSYMPIIDRIFFVIYILLITAVISKLLGEFIMRWLRVQKRFEKTPQLINKIIVVFTYLIAVIIILDHFSIEITPLVTTLGLGGLAVGLALQNTLTNFFAGLHIISDKPVNVGDFIELDSNTSGYVDDISWRSTKIKKLSGVTIVVPNAKLAESVIVNNSTPQNEQCISVQCGVSYKSDLKKVEKITLDVARKIQKTVPGAVEDFEPSVRYNTFGDSNINFSVVLKVKQYTDKYLITHEFIKALKERYDREKIDISWPVRMIYQGGK